MGKAKLDRIKNHLPVHTENTVLNFLKFLKFNFAKMKVQNDLRHKFVDIHSSTISNRWREHGRILARCMANQ